MMTPAHAHLPLSDRKALRCHREKMKKASLICGTCEGWLWLLRSRPDQIHHSTMRRDPPERIVQQSRPSSAAYITRPRICRFFALFRSLARYFHYLHLFFKYLTKSQHREGTRIFHKSLHLRFRNIISASPCLMRDSHRSTPKS